jgi:hypothetical protein
MAEDGIRTPQDDGPTLVSRRRRAVAVHVDQDAAEVPATQQFGQSAAMDPPKTKLVCCHDVDIRHPAILSSRSSDRVPVQTGVTAASARSTSTCAETRSTTSFVVAV